jgi:hypothetical protein
MKKKEFKLKIREEADLYSPLDPDRDLLSDEIIDYFTRLFLNQHRALREDYSICIYSDSPVNEAHVKESIQREFGRKKDDVGFEMKHTTIKGIVFGSIGLAVLALWLVLSAVTENLGVEVLSIVSCALMWEAVSIFFMERPAILRMKRNIERLMRAEITFYTTEIG